MNLAIAWDTANRLSCRRNCSRRLGSECQMKAGTMSWTSDSERIPSLSGANWGWPRQSISTWSSSSTCSGLHLCSSCFCPDMAKITQMPLPRDRSPIPSSFLSTQALHRQFMAREHNGNKCITMRWNDGQRKIVAQLANDVNRPSVFVRLRLQSTSEHETIFRIIQQWSKPCSRRCSGRTYTIVPSLVTQLNKGVEINESQGPD